MVLITNDHMNEIALTKFRSGNVPDNLADTCKLYEAELKFTKSMPLSKSNSISTDANSETYEETKEEETKQAISNSRRVIEMSVSTPKSVILGGKYQLKEVLGEGISSQVYQGLIADSQTKVAIKI